MGSQLGPQAYTKELYAHMANWENPLPGHDDHHSPRWL